MEINQFAVINRDLHTQIKVIENLVRVDLFKEATKLLPTAEETCESLASLMKSDNTIQRRIVSNRQLDIKWLGDTIQEASIKKAKSPVKKRKVK